jgi:hypothetical protein
MVHSMGLLSSFEERKALNFLRNQNRLHLKKTPRIAFAMRGGLNWQRPTFAGPIAQLSSAQQRFTSVFGMGTGGATVPWSPDYNSQPEGVN